MCCIELGGELYLPKKDCWLEKKKAGDGGGKKIQPVTEFNYPFTTKKCT